MKVTLAGESYEILDMLAALRPPEEQKSDAKGVVVDSPRDNSDDRLSDGAWPGARINRPDNLSFCLGCDQRNPDPSCHAFWCERRNEEGSKAPGGIFIPVGCLCRYEGLSPPNAEKFTVFAACPYHGVKPTKCTCGGDPANLKIACPIHKI